jgi:hypothetical protein
LRLQWHHREAKCADQRKVIAVIKTPYVRLGIKDAISVLAELFALCTLLEIWVLHGFFTNTYNN